jgi:hypothetical protein
MTMNNSYLDPKADIPGLASAPSGLAAENPISQIAISCLNCVSYDELK